MLYSAIIFDLYLTLARGFSMTSHEIMVAQMAEMLGARDSKAFTRLFSHETWIARATGQFMTIEDNIAAVCERLGLPVDAARIAAASRVRYAFMAQAMTPLPGALDTLAVVRARGYKTALISDCSAETPMHWPQTAYAPLIDTAIFSCRVGILKPHPKIYAAACAELGIAPKACVYVGDRQEELLGAREAGMYGIMSLPPHSDTYEAQMANRPVWDGPVIPGVTALPPLLNTLSQ
jgi:putative hydrolase of the HAD superfamily